MGGGRCSTKPPARRSPLQDFDRRASLASIRPWGSTLYDAMQKPRSTSRSSRSPRHHCPDRRSRHQQRPGVRGLWNCQRRHAQYVVAVEMAVTEAGDLTDLPDGAAACSAVSRPRLTAVRWRRSSRAPHQYLIAFESGSAVGWHRRGAVVPAGDAAGSKRVGASTAFDQCTRRLFAGGGISSAQRVEIAQSEPEKRRRLSGSR